VRSGPVLVLPDEIAELLDDASPASDAASDATVAAFLTEHVRSDQPNMLQGLQKALRQRIDAGESRHMATVSALAGRSQLLPHPHDCDRTASIPISFGQRYRLVVDLASTSWCRRRSGCRTSPQRLDSDRGRRCGLHTSPTDFGRTNSAVVRAEAYPAARGAAGTGAMVSGAFGGGLLG
jgi:hypothetical protein